jgi:hypothetical protein
VRRIYFVAKAVPLFIFSEIVDGITLPITIPKIIPNTTGLIPDDFTKEVCARKVVPAAISAEKIIPK